MRVYIFILMLILAINCGAHKQDLLSKPPPNETPPQILENVKPDYPRDAFNMGIEGTVWVKIFVDTTGTVTEAMILKDSGKDVGFEREALNAAYKTKWKPAYSEGKPINTWVSYKITFELNR